MKTLALISGDDALHGLWILLIVGVVIGIVLWLVSISPIPEPFKKVITWLCYAFAAAILINFLLGLIGHSFITF